jgi:hypothetical protein
MTAGATRPDSAVHLPKTGNSTTFDMYDFYWWWCKCGSATAPSKSRICCACTQLETMLHNFAAATTPGRLPMVLVRNTASDLKQQHLQGELHAVCMRSHNSQLAAIQ